MRQNADGSITLLPGESAPAGYTIVSQNPDGSSMAAPQANQTPVPASPTSQASGLVVPALAAKQVYNMVSPAAPAAPAAAAPAASTGSSILSMSAAGNSAPAGTVIGVDSAGRDIISSGAGATGGFGGLAAGQITPMSGLAGIAGAYSLHNQFAQPLQGSTLSQGLQGAAGGAGIGFMAGGPVGMGIGAAAGGAIGLARGAFGHRRSGFELMVRGVNAAGGQSGLFYSPTGGDKGSNQAHMKLADGTLYNVEAGGFQGAPEGDRSFSVDPNAKWGKQATAWAGILGDVMTGGPSVPEGASVYLTGSIANGALSNANGDIEVVRANILKQVENLGLDQEKLEAALTQLRDQGKIDEALYNWRMNDLQILFSGQGYDARTMQEWTTRDQAQAGQSPSTTGPAPLPNGAPGLPPGNRVAQNIPVGVNVQQAAANAHAMPVMGTIPTGYRSGSARAGGIVDNKTGQWYPDSNSIPR